MLGMLDGFDPVAMRHRKNILTGRNDALSYADRAEYAGDPEFVSAYRRITAPWVYQWKKKSDQSWIGEWQLGDPFEYQEA